MKKRTARRSNPKDAKESGSKPPAIVRNRGTIAMTSLADSVRAINQNLQAIRRGIRTCQREVDMSGVAHAVRDINQTLEKLRGEISKRRGAIAETARRAKAAKDHPKLEVRSAWKGAEYEPGFGVIDNYEHLPSPFGRGRRQANDSDLLEEAKVRIAAGEKSRTVVNDLGLRCEANSPAAGKHRLRRKLAKMDKKPG